MQSIYFYKFLECIKAGRFYDGQDQQLSPKEQLNLIETKPFIFSTTPKDKLTLNFDPEKWSPPFKSCFFEAIDGDLLKIINSKNNSQMMIKGINLEEESPGKYLLMALYCDKDETAFGLLNFSNTPDANNSEIELMDTLAQLCNWFLEKIHTEKLGSINPRTVVKSKINGEKRIHRINQIIYVSSKKEYNKANTHAGREIDWSHRWAVRGHWRNIEGIGKDREGVYQVKGFTWIKDFVKGPEDKVFVKKLRIVK